VADGLGDHEVAVGEPLHQGAGAEAVGAVVREVGLADDVQAGQGALQVVVDPETAHGVVRGRIDAHGHLVGVLPRDLLIHVEEVAVALADGVLAQARDGVREVEIDASSHGPYPAALVADLLGGA